MSAATASTTAGATLAASSFADTILGIGISAVWGAAMVNSGAKCLTICHMARFFTLQVAFVNSVSKSV